MKKLIALLATAVVLSAAAGSVHASGSEFSDLPESGWARDAILSAYEYGLMNGMGGDTFGVGRSMSRAEFVTVLVRMFSWSTAPGDDAFTDLSGSWARDYINTAAANGVVDAGGAFRPDQPITRREMAVMLVRALGYQGIANSAESYSTPFTDVSADRGYIAVAYDIGMINGTSSTTFAPEASATREQAAAMLVRIYEKYISSTEWTHAFYAISSYSQLELAKQFDAVSFGWSRMTLSASEGAWLNTTSANGNEYCIPSGYSDAVRALQAAGVKLHLCVYMDTASSLAELLSSETYRAQAIDAIMDELTRTYDEMGSNPYSGVTLDFEGLRSAQKANYTQFLTELRQRLDQEGKTLYVAVMAATADGVYYDGYDYRAIGELADKVLLMAHDYNAKSLTGFLNSKYYMTTALTPINSVYYSLRAACDSTSGVQDRSKLALAVSFSSIAWETDEAGQLISEAPLYPTTRTIYSRLAGGAEMGWSETYRNPYLRYITEDGQHIFLWYEDSRSVGEKAALSRMFGITGVSFWRLGNLPDYNDPGLYYNVMDALS